MNNKKHIIAIFDDDEDILAICRYIFEDAGYQVYTFENCSEVLAKVTGCDPDIILMDNWIPNEGGIAATRLLKGSALHAKIPVIYFTANADIDQLAKAAGADAYIAKPFDLDNLLRMTNSYLQPVS